MRYSRTGRIGGKGVAPHQFRSTLRGVALDSTRRLYAVGDREVKLFDSAGDLVRKWPTARPGISVCAGPDGRVFVGESGHVEIFSDEGRLLQVWRDKGRLGLVTAIGCHEDAVFVADARAPGMDRYDRKGKHVLSIGDRRGRRGFVVPGGFLDFGVDEEGVIHATNPGKHRVERYASDGELLGSFGRFGMHDPADFRGCCNPINLALARAGRVVVVEKAPPRVKVYGPDRELLAVIDDKAFDPACRYLDVAVDRDGRLYVADSVRLEIHVFTPHSVGPTEPSRPLQGAKHER